MDTECLAAPGETVRDLGAGWSPSGTVCMTHRRVATLLHLLIQSPAALQVDAYRQRELLNQTTLSQLWVK